MAKGLKRWMKRRVGAWLWKWGGKVNVLGVRMYDANGGLDWWEGGR